MTLSVLEGHLHIASLLSAIFRICGASRGPSASAELFMIHSDRFVLPCIFYTSLLLCTVEMHRQLHYGAF